MSKPTVQICNARSGTVSITDDAAVEASRLQAMLDRAPGRLAPMSPAADAIPVPLEPTSPAADSPDPFSPTHSPYDDDSPAGEGEAKGKGEGKGKGELKGKDKDKNA